MPSWSGSASGTALVPAPADPSTTADPSPDLLPAREGLVDEHEHAADEVLTAWAPRAYSTGRLYNEGVMDTQDADQLSATFAALADPTRRAILARLARGEASVTELAAPFDMSQPAVSKHLRVLERAGLIERGRQAQWRPRRLKAGPLREVADWVGPYRRHWEESFERLDAYLREVQDRKEQQDGDDVDHDANRPR